MSFLQLQEFQPQSREVDFVTTMAACQYTAAGEDWEFMKCLFQGLSEAITGALQGHSQAQQAQGMTQAQINQWLQGQADLQQLNQQFLAALQQ